MSVLADRDIHAAIERGEIVVRPFDPRDVQPASIDLHLDNKFRVFRNNRYPYIDLRQPQPDLTELLADSGKVEACFARQFVRFAQSRAEDETVDGCALEAVRASLTSGESFRTALRKFALLPAFKQRLVAGDG